LLMIFPISFIISIIFFKLFIPKFKKWNIVQYVREEGPQLHNYKEGTTTSGGLIFNSLFVIILFIANFFYPSDFFLPVIVTAILFGVIGFLDDYLSFSRKNSKGLSGKVKLLFQIIFSIIIYLLFRDKIQHHIFIPFLENAYLDISFLYPVFFVLYLASFSNASNLADGLDGLSGGLAFFSAIGAQIFLFMNGVIDVSFIILSGVLLGFLWFNTKPASIFMGDSGSLALGAIFGVIGLTSGYSLFFMIICLVYWVELFSVVIQVSSFKLRKKRVFLMSPIHHHFELLGWTETKVVFRFWIINIFSISLALVSVII